MSPAGPRGPALGYEQLGFTQHTDPAESYPVDEFAAVAHGDHILFGLTRNVASAPVPPAGLEWQFETTDLEGVSRAATSAGHAITLPITVQPWGRRTMTIKSPNGYSVSFEEA